MINPIDNSLALRASSYPSFIRPCTHRGPPLLILELDPYFSRCFVRRRLINPALTIYFIYIYWLV
jgi:hypothetical protein